MKNKSKVIVVANTKGGSGKSTLSTNIAGYLASLNHLVVLADADPQQSSRMWLSNRPDSVSTIMTWDLQPDLALTARPTADTTHVVIDTPAGLNGWRLREVINRADKVVVPILPSSFDIQASHDFLIKLRQLCRESKTEMAVVGNRVDARTLSSEKLKTFLDSLNMPILSYLRDTQYYLHLAANGLSMFDITPTKIQKDLDQWQPICKWLDAN
ncbi:MAG: ParA family protein [Limnohabitans sp.]|nr:ParA family protein [Limnohabitans sp.]